MKVAIPLGLLVAFLATGGGLLPGSLPVPVDEVARGYPHRGVVGEVHVGNALTNDTTRQMLPWMRVVREQLVAGEWPLWNPYAFSGSPLLGNGQSAPFSPFFLATLFVPLPKQIVAMAFLKVFCAFVFTFLFLRGEGRSTGAAVWGGVAFSLGLFHVVYLYYPMTAVTVLLPALLWSVRGVVTDGRRRWSVALALVTIAALAGGHPESVLHLALAALIHLAISRPSRAALARVAIVVALATVIAAPAWVPVLEQVFQSDRFAGIESRVSGHFPAMSAWALVNPNGFGHPARNTWSWIFNYSMVSPTYLGGITLVLVAAAIAGLKKRPLWFIAAGVLLFLIALDWTPIAQLLNQLPPFSITANDRLRFVALFFLVTAGAAALDELCARPLIVAWITGASFIGVSAYLFSKKFGITLETRDAVGAMAVALFVGCATFAPRRAAMIAALCTAVELFTFGVDFNALNDGARYRPHLPIVDALRARAPEEPFRVVGFDWVFNPNSAGEYGLEDIRGSDPMAPAAYQRFFQQIASDDSKHEFVKRVQDLEHPGLAFLNVRFAFTEPGFGGARGWQRVYSGPDGELYESTSVRPRFFPESFTATITNLRSEGPARFRFHMQASEAAFIASSQPLLPGWRVHVGGHDVPMTRVNGAFIGFVAPPGTSDVLVSYRPTSFFGSIIASIAALIAFSWLILLSILNPQFSIPRSEPA